MIIYKSLFIFCLVFFISCKEITLHAGEKTEGYCINNDYFFSFKNCYFSSQHFFYRDFSFDLLMENDIIAKCKIKENMIQYKKLEIVCKIDNFSGCFEETNEILNLGKNEPKTVIHKFGDIIHFQGFCNKKRKINDNKFTPFLFQNENEEEIYIYKNIYPGIIQKPENNNNTFYKFIIENNTMDFDSSEIYGETFIFIISISNKEENIKSYCSINNSLIECRFFTKEEIIDIKIENSDDVIIKFPIIYQFKNYTDIGAYIIKAGKIKKLPRELNMNYQFQIDLKSSFIEEIYIKLYVSFINESEKRDNNAYCSLNDTCAICMLEEINMPDDIIITENPSSIINGSNSLYFENFDGKRTLTIKAGKLSKGICNKNNNLEFQILNNYIPKEKFNGTFQLEIIIEEKKKNSTCYYDLSEKQNNNITCFVENYICSDDMIITIGNKDPEPDYDSLELISVYFEGFANLKYQICINMEEEGMIIKNLNEEKNKFKLTKNQIINNQTINETSNFSLNVSISNIKDNTEKYERANCSLPIVENNKKFDIECSLNRNISEEDEIIIIEEPENDKFDFSGYKYRRTLTLIGGHLEKGGSNTNFMLINNKFTGEVPYPLNETINFNITNANPDDNKAIANCSLNTNVLNDTIDMNCQIIDIDDSYDTITMSIINNPYPIPLSGGITLYFNKFSELSIYTLK